MKKFHRYHQTQRENIRKQVERNIKREYAPSAFNAAYASVTGQPATLDETIKYLDIKEEELDKQIELSEKRIEWLQDQLKVYVSSINLLDI